MGTRVDTSGARQRLILSEAPNDPAVRDQLVVENLPLVHRLCWRFRHSGEPLEDLVQVGTIGLMKAIQKYDPSRGYLLTTFAIPVIVGEIKNYFRDHGWAVKVPRKLQRQKLVVDQNVELLRQRLGRSPSIQEIVDATGLSEDEVYDTFEVERYARPISLDAEYEGDGNVDGSCIVDNLGSEDPRFEELIDRIYVAGSLDTLDERERAIIGLRFYSGLSQNEVARRLGISQMHVSRLQRSALAKLKLTLSS